MLTPLNGMNRLLVAWPDCNTALRAPAAAAAAAAAAATAVKVSGLDHAICVSDTRLVGVFDCLAHAAGQATCRDVRRSSARRASAKKSAVFRVWMCR